MNEELLQLIKRCDVDLTSLQKIISALRGPDTDNVDDALKWFTTARIRSIVTPSYVGDVNPVRLTKAEQIVRDELLLYGSTHFRIHYVEAASAIQEVFDYDLLNEQEVTED